MEMKTFAVEVQLQGTIHIKATSQKQAERILEKICSNTIDGGDGEWFSDIPSRYRSRASFSTKFTATGMLQGASPVEVPNRSVNAAQRRWQSNWAGLKQPYDGLSKAHEQVPVYSASLDLTTTAFIFAENVDLASLVVDRFKQTSLDFLDGGARWFSGWSSDDKKRSALPLVLSSALYVVGKSKSCKLTQAWPDHAYQGPEFITMIDEYL
jgi:hypothetical protein